MNQMRVRDVYTMLGITRPQTQPTREMPLYTGRWTWVDPDVAREMLAKMHPRNRRPGVKRVNELIMDAVTGKWVDAPNCVSFDVNGLNIDGRHRLTSIVKSGVGQWLYIVLNVPIEVMPGIDNVRSRSHKNTVEMLELEVGQDDITLVRTLSRRGQLPDLSKSGSIAYAMNNLASLRFVNNAFNANKKTTPGGVGTFAVRSVIFCAMQNPAVPPVIDEFLKVYLGAQLPGDLKHPAYILRDKMRASVGQQYAESGMANQIAAVERYLYNMVHGRFPNPKLRINPVIFPNNIQP